MIEGDGIHTCYSACMNICMSSVLCFSLFPHVLNCSVYNVSKWHSVEALKINYGGKQCR